MTLQWIPLDDLAPHPENSNRMPPRLLEKLKGHIQRTGRYEPLVVRPLQMDEVAGGAGDQNESRACPTTAGQASRATEAGGVSPPNPQSAIRNPQYQLLNGHHRAQALRELGHTHARCDVWEVDDAEARLLLATLNRLEGRDDPALRARLVSNLAGDVPASDLAALLPEPPDAVERLLKLAAPPPAPLAPETLLPTPRPMTFFLTDEQHAAVSEALREVAGDDHTPGGTNPVTAPRRPSAFATSLQRTSDGRGSNGLTRADSLEHLALWYLETRGRR